MNGSLGFTLCQTDDSTVLRHTIKALVKEPALSDGRIRPGDKLISAYGQDCSALSHTELISFLRKIGNDSNSNEACETGTEIELRFYRDASRSQTPITPPSVMHSNQCNDLFPSKHQSSNKMATKSHPNLPSFLGTYNYNQSVGNCSKTQKRLRQEAKEMVINARKYGIIF